MRSEHEQVLTTGARVLFAPGANLDQLADQAQRDLSFEVHYSRREAHLMRHHERELIAFGVGEEFISFGERHCRAFLREDMRAAPKRGERHLEVPFGPSW